MSEYQYYEFVAIDGPISDEGLDYARSCSSRAQVSRFRWHNVHHFGSFHGNEERLLEHYDAHFYIANWATVRLGLAFPEGCLSQEAIQPYLRGGERYQDTLTVTEIGKRWIVWWERHEDETWWETEGQGIVDQLIGIREELMRGDHRALFLGWLADFDPDEWTDSDEGTVVVPPIPGELNHLSPALAALIEHFPVDPDALTVAAGLSQAAPLNRIPITTAVERLPVSEMRSLLARVANGEGSRVMSELNRLTNPATIVGEGPAVTCMEFAAKVVAVREARRHAEAKAEAAKQKREKALREQHLVSVMQRADAVWASLDPLMDQKTAAAYDQVAAQLEELRDAHAQAGNSPRFEQDLAVFRERYARRSSMLRKIEKL